MGDGCPLCDNIKPEFETIDACVTELEREREQRPVLFRGEKCLFQTSSPGTLRVLADDKLTFDEKTFLLDACMLFQEWFEQHYPASIDDCDMFLQHYGIPTDLMDFTDSPRIAAYFAFKDWSSHIGRVAILPLHSAREAQMDVIPFGEFEFGGVKLKRPARQRAWAVRHHAGDSSDFNDPEVIRRLGIRWVTFRKRLVDSKLFDGLETILDATNDACAIKMRAWLNHFGSATWQGEDVAKRMSERIRACL
jgi:hypothetical protein